MSGSNPFDDLATDADDGEADRSDAPAADDATGTADDSPAAGESATDRSDGGRADDASVEGPTLTNSSPPFPYSEAEQKQMYVQDGLWDEFEDLGFDAELELRRGFEVRNVEQRELDTAVVRLVLDRFSAREIAEMVVQMRGFEPTEEG